MRILNTTFQEEITDPEKHNTLLKNFGIEEKKKKVKEKTLPVEPTDKELDGMHFRVSKYVPSIIKITTLNRLLLRV